MLFIFGIISGIREKFGVKIFEDESTLNKIEYKPNLKS